MNSLASLIAKYTANYQMQLEHPQHGLVRLTSSIWAAHPELQTAVAHTAEQLDGVQQVNVLTNTQLVVHYDSQQLKRNNPLTVMNLERDLRTQYRAAGF